MRFATAKTIACHISMWRSIIISICVIIAAHYLLEYLKHREPEVGVGVSFQTKKTTELIEELRQIRNNTKIELEISASDTVETL